VVLDERIAPQMARAPSARAFPAFKRRADNHRFASPRLACNCDSIQDRDAQ